MIEYPTKRLQTSNPVLISRLRSKQIMFYDQFEICMITIKSSLKVNYVNTTFNTN